jgi:hypothetical protein
MVFQMHKLSHIRMLARWLRHLNTLIGHNLPFDIKVLRYFHPLLKLALDGSHLLIDSSVIAYLLFEDRPEKSLKNLGPIMRCYDYDEEDGIRDGNRYRDPLTPNGTGKNLLHYNGQDTHNPLLLIPTLARRIINEYGVSPCNSSSSPPSPASPSSSLSSSSLVGVPNADDNGCGTSGTIHTTGTDTSSDKLTPFCLRFYSDTMWSTIRMSENGLPMDRRKLEKLEATLMMKCDVADSIARTRFGRCFHKRDEKNDHPDTDKRALLTDIVHFIRDHIDPDIYDHPLYTLTEGGMLSISDINRRLFEHLITDWLDTCPSNTPSSDASPNQPNPHSSSTSRQTPSSVSKTSLGTPVPTLASTAPATESRGTSPSKGGHKTSSRSSVARDHLLALKLLGIHIRAQKLVSSYTYPLLRHNRNDPGLQQNRLIPRRPRCPVPSSRRSPSPTRMDQPGTSPSQTPSVWSLDTLYAEPLTSTSLQQAVTEDQSGIRSRQRRSRSHKQWLKRHADRLLARSSHGNPRVRKLRHKRATPKQVFVTYRPTPLPPRRTLGLASSQDRSPLVELSHPSWFTTPGVEKDTGGAEGGTATGRITCKNFRHQTDGDPIKATYTSRYPGGLIVSYDLDQVEMRDAGVLSGEPSIVSAYEVDPPLDLHGGRAVSIFGEDALLAEYGEPLSKANERFSKQRRQPAKHFNFGDLFRAGAKKLQVIILKKGDYIIDLAHCERDVANRPRVRPQLVKWQDNLIAFVKGQGYVIMPLTGQSRMFLGGEKYDVNEIVNMPVQCFAGDTLLRIQAYIHHHGPSINMPSPPFLMFHQCYDSVFFDVRHPRHLPALDKLWDAAVTWVGLSEFWHWMCMLHDTHLPLTYERTIHA